MWIVDAFAHETLLFAGVGLLLGGIDDLLIDLVYIVRRILYGRRPRLTLATLAPPHTVGRIAVFVAAWDEVAVIGGMLSAAVERYEHDDYRIYVGLYPNDRATIDAAAAVAERDPRIRLVIGPRDGPTTKADCLNTLWKALRRDDARDDARTKAIVLHDAEDVVHAQELRVFDSLIDRYEVVQLPVLPLVNHGSRLVSGHYADEFAESNATPHSLGAMPPQLLGDFNSRPEEIGRAPNHLTSPFVCLAPYLRWLSRLAFRTIVGMKPIGGRIVFRRSVNRSGFPHDWLVHHALLNHREGEGERFPDIRLNFV
ncbi:glycosyltransferase [Sphingomonas sp. PP-F2F-G114-C0414]|uniref:glycosyltransferase n=1 Tax=Sphingomonas sp. PP-F2F-G114-C0414 TaxID=2135662 RepID=UPI000EF8ABCB|nr:glycosyltransferase [Sphingomonas sp. PP-F2F-G114-C0414]